MLDRSDHDLKRLRQARYKARQRAGVVVWRIEVNEERFTKLVRLGYLRPNESDPRQGAKALERLIDGIELPLR
jgi:hypothetical protein